jgi:hypothetical protein
MLNANIDSFLAEVRALDLSQPQVALDIDGLTYRSQKLGALKGMALFPRLVQVFGPLLDSIMLPESGQLDSGVIMRVASMAAEDNALPKICQDMLANVTVSEIKGVGTAGAVAKHIDTHFAGDYIHLVKVLIFSAMHSFMGPTRGAS